MEFGKPCLIQSYNSICDGDFTYNHPACAHVDNRNVFKGFSKVAYESHFQKYPKKGGPG